MVRTKECGRVHDASVPFPPRVLAHHRPFPPSRIAPSDPEMFIIVTGSRASGKRTIQDYLVRWKGFEALRLAPGSVECVGLGFGLPQLNGNVVATEGSITTVNSDVSTIF